MVFHISNPLSSTAARSVPKLALRSHAAARTRTERLDWAQGEGLTYLAEKAPGQEADLEPGRLSTPPAAYPCTSPSSVKLYCTLCAKYVTPSASALKQHCYGVPRKGKADEQGGEFMASEHAKKVEKLKDRASSTRFTATCGTGTPDSDYCSCLLVSTLTCYPLCCYPVACCSPKVYAPVQSESEPLPAPKKPLAHLHLRVTGWFLKPRHSLLGDLIWSLIG